MVQIGRDRGDEQDGEQRQREAARAAPGDQHHDGGGQKQRGEFHPRPDVNMRAVHYNRQSNNAIRACQPGDLIMRTDLAVILTALTLYLAITVSPGPNLALVSRLAISGSRRAAVGASPGIASADFVYAILSMTGLAVLLREVGWVARGVQIVGGCYLVYLGLSAWFNSNKTSVTGQPPVARSTGN